MKAIIYLGMVVAMMMAFEVRAWDDFERSGVDVSSWYNESDATPSEWQVFTSLGHGRSKSLIITEKTLKVGKTIVAVTQKIQNKTNTPYCLIAKISEEVNAINTLKRHGLTIILPGEEKFIGGYRINTMGRNWKVHWKFKGTKNLNLCD
ncbi:hypothetical protein A9Q84_17740 [Halobacteriovorax marinus]|uniref:Uncharacterized protein n=1 Tax=Halobacteriovorax marinus TaxID=97084 RepID=A0A1Y5F3K9_9BACT|nr:hypothetical protein A9Q84_17740 [Halobacteriovorax marinus]